MTRTRLFLHGRRLVMNDLHAQKSGSYIVSASKFSFLYAPSKINLVIRLTSFVHCLASSGAAFSNCFNLLASSGSRLLLCRWLNEDVRVDQCGFRSCVRWAFSSSTTVWLRNNWEILCEEAYEAGEDPHFTMVNYILMGICVNLDLPTLFLLFLTVNESKLILMVLI